MTFLGHVSFSGALWGFVEQWKGNPYRWRVLAVSIALTAMVLYVFIPETERGPPKPYDVVYISTFEEGRTDEQIAESNRANQEVQDGYRALEQERVQIRRDAAEAIGRATGLDVDSMKTRIAREEAAAEQERERRRAELLARAEAARKARAEGVDE